MTKWNTLAMVHPKFSAVDADFDLKHRHQSDTSFFFLPRRELYSHLRPDRFSPYNDPPSRKASQDPFGTRRLGCSSPSRIPFSGILL